MKICRNGVSRTVFLAGKYAIKIPSCREYRMFLHGLLANMQEVVFSKTGWPELCPICFYLPLGLMVIMPRCEPMLDKDFQNFDYEKFTVHDDYTLTYIENKPDSFGILNGKVVAIDYGY